MSLWDEEDVTEDEILDRWFDAGVVVLCVTLIIVAIQLSGGV